MKLSELQHGDVLLYTKSKRQSIFVRGIRLITGSKYTHAGIVISRIEPDINLNSILFIEQLLFRNMAIGETYNVESFETISVVRPLKGIPQPLNKEFSKRKPYGISGIIDCMINHFLGRIFIAWKYKRFFSKFTKNVICSALVAQLLNTSGFIYFDIPEIVEPDDYANRVDLFEPLGTLEL